MSPPGAVTPIELNDGSRYTPVWTVDHSSVAQALQPFIWRRSWISVMYIVATVAAVGMLIVAWQRSRVNPFQAFSMICLGMTSGYVLLMPIHELIHAAAYRALGARSVRIRYQWRTLTAYCVADRFVVDRRALAFVCFAPFVVINSLVGIASVFASGLLGLVVAGALFMHIGACSGDVALVNWSWLVGSAETRSYDDLSTGRTTFFEPTAATIGSTGPSPAG
jgi:hypothetical protein